MVDIARLQQIVGAAFVRTEEDARSRAVSLWPTAVAKRRQAGLLTLPSAVVSPADTAEVAAILQWANETGTPLYPVGGASNLTEATASPPEGIAVDLSRLDNVTLDEESLLVTIGAGTRLSALEATLNEKQYTLGQVPQSFKLATIGGAIATDAIGALSGKYGRMRDSTAGLEVVLPTGQTIRTSPTPGANSAFNLHDLFIGSEGRFGIITEATLQFHPQPEVQAWMVFSFRSLSDAIDAARLIYRSDSRPTLVRVFDTESASSLCPGSGALLIASVEGQELAQTGHYQLAYGVCQAVGGSPQASFIGDTWYSKWQESDWLSANARPGGLADIFAVSAPWSAIKSMERTMRQSLSPLVTRLTTQIAHPTPNGASLELRYEAQATPATLEATIALYDRITEAGYSACFQAGGSVAHHLGVGSARWTFLKRERGDMAIEMLLELQRTLDPQRIMGMPPTDHRPPTTDHTGDS